MVDAYDASFLLWHFRSAQEVLQVALVFKENEAAVIRASHDDNSRRSALTRKMMDLVFNLFNARSPHNIMIFESMYEDALIFHHLGEPRLNVSTSCNGVVNGEKPSSSGFTRWFASSATMLKLTGHIGASAIVAQARKSTR